MPTKDCASSAVDDEVRAIEADGGRVTQLVPVGDGAYKIVYEEGRAKRARPGDVETRS